MAGWFRKKINSAADYKGLKMRIGAGLGNKVVTKAGGTAVLIPAAGIFAAFERGVIDAAEWVGPHDDMELGLHNSARYYYYPGWHEPGTVREFSFHRKAYDGLPVDLRQLLDHAIEAEQVYCSAYYHAKYSIALSRLKSQIKAKANDPQLPPAPL